MNYVVVLLLAALVVLTFRNYRRDARRKVQSRGSAFDDCAGLLQDAQHSLNQAHLPVLQGRYDGYRVVLSVVEDTLGWRKVPPLWLLVKVEANRASRGSLDYIVRPANNEFYSPSWQWDGNLAIPADWPQHAILKYQQQPLDLKLVDTHVRGLFGDAKMKELLILPDLVRLTYLAKQADRGEYLIMRNAIYENVPLEREVVEKLVRQAIAIRRDVEQAAA